MTARSTGGSPLGRGLYVNCAPAQCSIYESGVMFARALQGSARYELDTIEVESFDAIPRGYAWYAFNYHHVTMRWLDPRRLVELDAPVVAFVLEMLPDDPFCLCPDAFDAYCVPDPTLRCADDRVVAFPRPLEVVEDLPAPFAADDRGGAVPPVFGSFGFATPGKGFEAVVVAVGREYERAIVRLNIPIGTFADPDGARARRVAEHCSGVAPAGVEVRVDHSYLSKPELVAWCAQNTANLFFYHRKQPGLSATTDQAITAGRPLLVSPCDTFRHIHEFVAPYPRQSIRDVVRDGAAAVAAMREAWHPSRFRERFEGVIASVVASCGPSSPPAPGPTVAVPRASAPARPTALYVNHRGRSCGVYEFGKSVGDALSRSRRYRWVAVECASFDEARLAVARERPAAVVWNWHHMTMPWLTAEALDRLEAAHIGTLHEVTDAEVDAAGTELFDAWVAPDPTVDPLRNPAVVPTGRVLHALRPIVDVAPEVEPVVVGSFGLALPDKGFERVIDAVQEEFDEAVVRLHVPSAEAIDPDGTLADRVVASCHARVTKPRIRLEISREHLEEDALLDWLAANSINVFLYDETKARGISSVLDWAIAAGRPFAVNECPMFRHVAAVEPSVSLARRSLRAILADGVRAVRDLRAAWSIDRVVATYDDVVARVTARGRRATCRFADGISTAVPTVWAVPGDAADDSWVRALAAACGRHGAQLVVAAAVRPPSLNAIVAAWPQPRTVWCRERPDAHAVADAMSRASGFAVASTAHAWGAAVAATRADVPTILLGEQPLTAVDDAALDAFVAGAVDGSSRDSVTNADPHCFVCSTPDGGWGESVRLDLPEIVRCPACEQLQVLDDRESPTVAVGGGLESAANPVRALEALVADRAGDAETVTIVVPNLAGLSARMRGRAWLASRPTRPRWVFTAASLGALVREAGLECVDVRTRFAASGAERDDVLELVARMRPRLDARAAERLLDRLAAQGLGDELVATVAVPVWDRARAAAGGRAVSRP